MDKHIYVILMIISAFLIKGGDMSFAQTPSQQYRVHIPEISVPSDDTGAIRRIISQFKYWTLICDENNIQKTIICNVRQLIFDKDDGVVFSWSLAANEDKKPFILMRLPPNIDKKIPISIKFDDLALPMNINYSGCDNNFCTAQTTLDPLLLREISMESIAHISYVTADGHKIAFDAPLLGLKNAVQSIQVTK